MKDDFKKQYLILSVIFVILITLPTIISFLLPKPGYDFTWFVNSSVDSPVYMSRINNGKYFDTLELFMRSNHQSTDIKGGLLFLLYSIFGLIFGNLGMNTGAIFFMMKVLCSTFFLFSAYLFIKEFIKQENQWLSALLLLFASSITNLIIYIKTILGLTHAGTQFLPADIFPIDSSLVAPHFICAISLMLLSLITVKKYDKNKWKYSVINGFILLGIATIHPQVAVFIGLLEGIYLLTEIKNRSYKIKDLLPVSLWGIIPFPYLVYCLYIFNNYTSLIIWTSRNIHPYDLPTICFFIIPAICLILFIIFKYKNIIKENKLLFIWSIGIILTAFLPGKFQVKMTEGASIPFIMLLIQIFSYHKIKNIKKISTIGVSILLLPIIFTMFIPKYFDTLMYVPEYYTEMYKDLDELPQNSIIFSNSFTSTMALANTKQIYPVSGNPDECIKYKEYMDLFIQGAETKDFSFLKDIDVDYYIFDNYISKNYESSEIERNLPYKKIKETENYIIYSLKEKQEGVKNE